MTPEQFKRVRKLFEKTLGLDPALRKAFLDDACSDDPIVREEVERLLREEVAAGAPTAPSEPPTTRATPDGQVGVGRQLGPYKLLRMIGEGGMGTVYEAEQESPIRRRVALKIIRHGLEGTQVMSRFEAERQALALMNHPNVTKVLDAGTTPDGRPFFVMEFIKGVAITDYCDRHDLPMRERLELMIQACEGVQHAHLKGIIHRDIKPSNILVEIQDGRPVPKIIDFGVARAVDRQLTERALFTEYGQIIGTPEYMSPEQAEMSPLDIDTRTDIYSLGVVLYELLVGALPFDPRELRRAAYDEIRRRIREETPPKPSTRLITLGPSSGEVARHRKSDPATLARLCRGDLDWITMKALEKDRTRRYASAADLALDLRRHLRNEPVTAGPPSAGYRVRKFVRRHRIGVSFAALIVLAFLVGFAGTAYGLVRALRAERQARLEAETTAEVSQFMLDMFEINDPSEARGNTITAREVLDRGAERIHRELAKQPALQGRLMEAMGTVYRSLGLYKDSRTLLEEAVQSRERAFGPEHPEVARSLTTLAGLLIKQGKQEETLPLLDRALRIQTGALDPADLELARTLNNLGNAHRQSGRNKEALPFLERSLAIREKALGPDDPEVAKMLNNVGSAKLLVKDFDGARRDLERALAIREKAFGPEHTDVANVLNSLAALYFNTGEKARARETHQRVLAIREKILGPEHPELVGTLLGLALVEKSDGHLPEARDYLLRALAIADRKLDPGHQLRRRTLEQLVEVQDKLGAMREAREAEEKLRLLP